MDLSFARFHDRQVTALPVELAVLMVGVASRQAASPTARTQAALAQAVVGEGLLLPASGCFSTATAAALIRWQQE